MSKNTIEITIESKLTNVTLLSKAVRAICKTVVEDENLLYKLELCIAEAVTNVIEHAYSFEEGNFIHVLVELDENAIIFHVKDSGKKTFTLPAKKELDFDPKDILSLPEEGMGIFLIHKIMDEVTLCRNGEMNVMMMKKQIKQEKSVLKK
jgi:serine/threonine-protein kinase RsbW